MPNLCNLTLIGHLGRDAETKQAGSAQLIEFSVAHTSKAKDKELTTWFRCHYWGERAVKVAQYLTKGKAVCVVGSLSEREYQAKDGTAKRSLEIRVESLVLLGGKDDAEAPRHVAAPVSAAPKAAPARPQPADDEPPF